MWALRGKTARENTWDQRDVAVVKVRSTKPEWRALKTQASSLTASQGKPETQPNPLGQEDNTIFKPPSNPVNV